MIRQEIECHQCGSWCGWYYPSTRLSPAESEGPGEYFSDAQGRWHCSLDCLELTEQDEEEEGW